MSRRKFVRSTDFQKVKSGRQSPVGIMLERFLHKTDSWTEALHNLGSGS